MEKKAEYVEEYTNVEYLEDEMYVSLQNIVEECSQKEDFEEEINLSCQNAIEEFTQEEYLEDEMYFPLQNSVNECTLKDNLKDSHLETKNEELTRLEEAFMNLSEHNSGEFLEYNNCIGLYFDLNN
ncbi:hypothetical protein ACFFRR_005843 [Megaselia abdita]